MVAAFNLIVINTVFVAMTSVSIPSKLIIGTVKDYLPPYITYINNSVVIFCWILSHIGTTGSEKPIQLLNPH